MLKQKNIFFNLIYEYRKYYIAAVLFGMLAFISTFTIPVIVKNLIDGIFVRKPGGLSDISSQFFTFLGGQGFLAQNLWLITLVILSLFLLYAGFMHFTIRYACIACENIVRSLRNKLYIKFQNLPDSFFAGTATGDLIQRSTSDITTVHAFLSGQLIEISRIILMMAVLIPMMFVINIKMAFLSLVLIPVIGFIVNYYFRLLIRQSISMEEKEGAMTTVIQENLSGIRVVRAFARQAYECEKFLIKNLAYHDSVIQRMNSFGTFITLATVLAFTQTGIVLIGGAWMVIQGWISLGTLIAFSTYSMALVFNFRALGIMMAEIGGSIVAVSRINEILEEPEKINKSMPVTEVKLTGDIRFENVVFSYKENEKALNDVSFHVKPGESIAIVGPSGSGKSSIIELLLKNYDCQEGSIQLDGVDLKNIDPGMVRSQIGTSLQEPFLFSTTIKSNIKIAKNSASANEVITASKTASIHDTIQTFPDAYDTEIGENGITLSGGQRHRVALARTFVRDPSILILDDSLSSVDTITELEIIRAMNSKHKGATIIIITHRLSCCLNADRIFVFENGELVKSGNHNRLVNEEGFYKRLWEIQNGIEQDSVH